MQSKKNPPQKKTKWIQLRVTEFEKNRIKWLAKQYAGGDMTRWILNAALNIDRKMLAEK